MSSTSLLLQRTLLHSVKTTRCLSPSSRRIMSAMTRPLSVLTEKSYRPFDKVLIANRGEIAERVERTCRELDIETVAIYSTADVSSRFVQQADEAVCVGPAAASESYLNVDRVVEAVRETGAQAVHPGYGFLSENSEFARAITDAGAVFLGPPVSAVRQMGDKLESKQLALQSGVNVIPGYDGPVESLEHALELANNEIGYPVLLKAAAGGGGKGMRVCHNDAEIRDAYRVSKDEAKKFFGDDRLLVEKFVVEPHHIEFQVMACKEGDGTRVAVFPERECSIQRRNQKIVEESPSVLLTDETRQQMATQVKRLCQAVGYESAGTVEFLVDANQQFYFLEMNTRLQVEHPVTEAVCGVDLVKAMLWIGAGWGLPDELMLDPDQLIVPHQGHAQEARIYAEDALRGFLPSTGPLTQYVEPKMDANTLEKYIRIDSGVAPGHVVSPYYDPMLSKLISYAPTRLEAIEGLQQALDEYVIEGVQHNARLVQSVLREPSFRSGDTPTSFLETHYPDGFHGVKLTRTEQEEFAVAAALIGATRREWLQQPPLTGQNDDNDDDDLLDEVVEVASPTFIVRLGGLFGTAFCVRLRKHTATVSCLDDSDDDGKERTINLDGPANYEPQWYLAHVSLDGTERTIQVIREAATGELDLQMCGANYPVLIQTPREYELSVHMKEPVPLDTSHVILSPMPGTLIRYAVHEGDEVEAGHELCVVEAMKMQNIIRSPRAGIIGPCRVAEGSSLQADEVILEFARDKEQS